MSDVQYNEVSLEEAGQRLDNYLMRVLKGVPKSHIYRIIRGGEVRVNKKRAQPSAKLMSGDLIRIPPIRQAEEKTVYVGDRLEKRLKESVLFEDESILVLNKPAGIAVHGGSGLSLGVIEAFRKMRDDLPYLELIHRLDKDTSGCLLLAKKRSFLRAVQALLAERKVKKIYWALLNGPWTGESVKVVDLPLQKNTLKSGERFVSVSSEGKASLTQYKLLENFSEYCLVEASPKTGRTHQIRVHSACLNQPIVGDEKYIKPDAFKTNSLNKSQLYLHARAIQFNLDGKKYHYVANIDNRFADTLKQLRSGSFLSHE